MNEMKWNERNETNLEKETTKTKAKLTKPTNESTKV